MTNKRGANLGLIALVIGLVILVVIGVIYFSIAPQEEVLELEIVGLTLCNTLDNDFLCEENVKGEFGKIDFMNVLIEVSGLQAKEVDGLSKIRYVQSREIIGPGNQVIESLTTIITKDETVASEGDYEVDLKNTVIILNNAKLGSYTLKITVVDKNTEKTVTQSKRFTIK